MGALDKINAVRKSKTVGVSDLPMKITVKQREVVKPILIERGATDIPMKITIVRPKEDKKETVSECPVWYVCEDSYSVQKPIPENQFIPLSELHTTIVTPDSEYLKRIEEVRNEHNKIERQKKKKEKLCVVTTSCFRNLTKEEHDKKQLEVVDRFVKKHGKKPTFDLDVTNRNKGCFVKSKCMVLDIDDVKDLTEVKNKISTIPVAALHCLSPSGNGLKIWVVFDTWITDADRYTKLYMWVVKKWFTGFDVDTSTKDVSRCTYLPLDPCAVLNDKAEMVDVKKAMEEIEMEENEAETERIIKRMNHKTSSKSKLSDEQVTELLGYCNDEAVYGLDGDRNERLKVIWSVGAACEGDLDRAEKLLHAWRPEEKNGEYRQKLLEGKSNGVSVGTLIYQAKKGGWKPPKKTAKAQEVIHMWEKKEINTELEKAIVKWEKIEKKKKVLTADEIAQKLKEYAEAEANPNMMTQYVFRPNNLHSFLLANGYRHYWGEGAKDDESTLSQIHGGIIESVNEEWIISEVNEDLKKAKEHGADDYSVGLMITEHTKVAGKMYADKSLQACLEVDRMKTSRDDENSVDLCYTDGICRLFKNKMERIEYDGSMRLWKDRVVNRQYRADPDFRDGEFNRFILNISKNERGEHDDERYAAYVQTFGALIHQHRKQSKSFAVLLTDAACNPEDPQTHGGTGKGILVKGLKYAGRSVLKIDCKQFHEDDKFCFQSVKKHHDIIFLDDINDEFNFKFLFSAITEGLDVEGKWGHKCHIPWQVSPRFVLSSNHMLPDLGHSGNRRLVVLQLSDHYEKLGDEGVAQEFGHQFFTDWDADEWGRFDSFVHYAVVRYLKYGLPKESISQDYKVKQVKESLGADLYENCEYCFPVWADGTPKIRSAIVAEIKSKGAEGSPQELLPKLRIFAKQNGYDFLESRNVEGFWTVKISKK